MTRKEIKRIDSILSFVWDAANTNRGAFTTAAQQLLIDSGQATVFEASNTVDYMLAKNLLIEFTLPTSILRELRLAPLATEILHEYGSYSKYDRRKIIKDFFNPVVSIGGLAVAAIGVIWAIISDVKYNEMKDKFEDFKRESTETLSNRDSILKANYKVLDSVKTKSAKQTETIDSFKLLVRKPIKSRRK